jgi:DNA ligase 1
MIKNFEKLLKYTSKGQVQEWQIFVDGDKFYTIEGIEGGKLTTSLPTFCKPKNENKKNATSGEEQAILEATAKHQKKLDSHYNEVLTKERSFFEPMLAHKMEDYEKLLFTVPTFISPKLDGLRAINEKNTQMSRNGKEYVSTPHLNQNGWIFDGELYNKSFSNDFNEIVSLCKKTKPTAEDLDASKKHVEYHIYDLPDCKGKFSERYKKLLEFFEKNTNPAFKLVEAIQVYSIDEIKKYHEQFLEEGYEGSMIRLDLGNYENKRSKQLLKYKNWMDEEFEITGSAEGEGGRVGTIGKFFVKLPNGNTCKSNIKGNFDYLKDIWKNKDLYVGKMATIKFFGYTPDGALRFPFVIKLNRQSYE